MKTYLIALAVYTAFSFVAPARAYHDGRSPAQYELDQQHHQRQTDRDGLQMRMNQQYQYQQLQNQMQQQQQQLQYQQHQEHMRNQGWGRPGLDGGVR